MPCSDVTIYGMSQFNPALAEGQTAYVNKNNYNYSAKVTIYLHF